MLKKKETRKVTKYGVECFFVRKESPSGLRQGKFIPIYVTFNSSDEAWKWATWNYKDWCEWRVFQVK